LDVFFKIISKYVPELASLFLADMGQTKLKKVKNISIYFQTTDRESTMGGHSGSFASVSALSPVM